MSKIKHLSGRLLTDLEGESMTIIAVGKQAQSLRNSLDLIFHPQG